MKATPISSCFVTPSLSTEQFIPDHCFMYLVKGSMLAYDGSKEYTISPGDCGVGRRNQLVKYTKQPDHDGSFKKLFVLFDQEFLKEFNKSYSFAPHGNQPSGPMIRLTGNGLIGSFIQSLTPYFNERGVLDEQFSQVKRTELLLVLLKESPSLTDVFFDFSNPEKIDLEEFMTRNFRFNVSIEHFAYLTGRSLSAFKRDFEKIFNATPSHWLVQKRLEEAHYLINKKDKKPTDIYLDLGFEDLSHFSFAFKKLFGHSPTQRQLPRKRV